MGVKSPQDPSENIVFINLVSKLCFFWHDMSNRIFL